VPHDATIVTNDDTVDTNFVTHDTIIATNDKTISINETFVKPLAHSLNCDTEVHFELLSASEADAPAAQKSPMVRVLKKMGWANEPAH